MSKQRRISRHKSRPQKIALTLRSALVLSLTMISVTTCGGTEPSQGDSFCAAARKLQFSDRAIAAMNHEDLEQVKAHNCTGQKLCGWEQRDCHDGLLGRSLRVEAGPS